MKRFLLFMAALWISSTAVFSQSYSGKIDYEKKKQDAVVIDYSYSQEAVENALIQKIEGMGNKAREQKGLFNRDKGFIVFKNASVSDISDRSMDYIVKIERKSRKEKDETTVYLVLNKDGENVLTDMDVETMSRVKSFLDHLLPDVEAADLELQIKAQEATVTKAEKKFKDLQDDQQSMEKKIKDLQDNLRTNAKNQEQQQKEIENQRQSLEMLRGKRVSGPITN
ncbi:MAG: hypothetical protein ABI480_04780 [Chitinophagaceae bacterium]